MQDIADACSDTHECDLFVYFPFWRSVSDDPHDTRRYFSSAVMKTARDSSINNATLRQVL